MDQNPQRLQTRIRFLLAVFIIGLVMSGLTAFPLATKLRILCSFVGVDPALPPSTYAGLQHRIAIVAEGLRETYARDCSFGVFGAIPLLLVRRDVAILQRIEKREKK